MIRPTARSCYLMWSEGSTVILNTDAAISGDSAPFNLIYFCTDHYSEKQPGGLSFIRLQTEPQPPGLVNAYCLQEDLDPFPLFHFVLLYPAIPKFFILSSICPYFWKHWSHFLYSPLFLHLYIQVLFFLEVTLKMLTRIPDKEFTFHQCL